MTLQKIPFKSVRVDMSCPRNIRRAAEMKLQVHSGDADSKESKGHAKAIARDHVG